MQTPDPTLDELQRSLSESLAQMRQLRQTLNAEGAGDLETQKDDAAVSWNTEVPAIESHRTALLGGTPPASDASATSTGPSGEEPPADKSAETAPPPAGATAGSSGEAVPTADGGSESTTLDRRNPFLDFISERLDPLLSCGEPRSKGGTCSGCSAKRSKPPAS